MTADLRLNAFAWPCERLGDALVELGRKTGWVRGGPNDLGPVPGSRDVGILDLWTERAAAILGLESEPLRISYMDLDERLGESIPGLWRTRAGRVLVVLGSSRRGVLILDPALESRWLDWETAGSIRQGYLEQGLAETGGQSLLATLSPDQAQRVGRLLARKRLSGAFIHAGWKIRPDPGSSFFDQARREGVVRSTAGVVAVHAIHYALFLLAWFIVGQAAFRGTFDGGWFAAWVLILITLALLGMLNRWLQGSLALRWGALIKRRLLAGGLRLRPDEIRTEGSGRLLGRVLESQVVETLALGGGVAALTSVAELGFAMAVLALGASGWILAPLLVAWVGVTAYLARRYVRTRWTWTRARVGLTHQLVEKMVGHRTRAVQDPAGTQADEDDRSLADYYGTARSVDVQGVRLATIVPRGWVVVALLGLTPALVWGDVPGGALAVAIGGIVLATRALTTLVTGANHLAAAWIAWQDVKSLFDAATRRPIAGAPAYDLFSPPTDAASAAQDLFATTPRPPKTTSDLLEVSRVDFAYRGRKESVLRQCSLSIAQGDRILLEGPSGGGKSTLAGIVQGRHEVDGGLVLLHGRDRYTLGEANWRHLVASVPQFHENHLFTETLAFNLLMGRRWPPEPTDLTDARKVCIELGLGLLISRMPAGMNQMVGEKGWQLSHGERSRVFVARALLQQSELLVLDESFAALDPVSLEQSYRCVIDRAPTLMLIAHP